jgi:ATPase complex subunit ATP10
LVNYDKHLAKRKQLVAEIMTSYWQDVKDMGRTRGKFWAMPTRLIRAERALYMPNFHGKVLRDMSSSDTIEAVSHSGVSILCLYTTGLGQIHCNTYFEQLSSETPRIDVHVQENPLKALLARVFLGSERKKRTAEAQARYFFVGERLAPEMKADIAMVNVLSGFVYLLDQRGRIRWAACGRASEEEKKALPLLYRRLCESSREEKALETEEKERDGRAPDACFSVT